jgi:hypothetical protein
MFKSGDELVADELNRRDVEFLKQQSARIEANWDGSKVARKVAIVSLLNAVRFARKAHINRRDVARIVSTVLENDLQSL